MQVGTIRVLVTAYAFLFAWIGLAIQMLLVVLIILRIRWHLEMLYWTGFFTMLVFGPIGIGASLGVRCISCASRLFDEATGPKHPKADSLPGLMNWATAVIRVLQRKPVICVNCGTSNP